VRSSFLNFYVIFKQNINWNVNATYSQTCIQWPPLGPSKSVRYWQLVVVQRSLMYQKFKMRSENGGRWRQVVAIRRLLLTQVWLYMQIKNVRWAWFSHLDEVNLFREINFLRRKKKSSPEPRRLYQMIGSCSQSSNEWLEIQNVSPI
jgi:hypothetical protein